MNPFRILLLLAMLAGCSKPNYVYRFQNNGQYNSIQGRYTSTTESVVIQKQRLLTIGDSLTSDNHHTNSKLLASASPMPVIYTSADKNKSTHLNADNKTQATLLPRAAITSHQSVTGEDPIGDPKKNNAATIGFAFSLVSMTIVFGFIIAPIFAIPAIILCRIGLKSEKKKLAKTGLILSIIALALGLIFLIYLAASGGYGM
jgi:hypothetical protein